MARVLPFATPLPALRGPDELGARLAMLSGFLRHNGSLWRPRPFVEDELAWELQFPDLAAWLRDLDEDQVDALHEDITELVDAPEPLGSLAAEALRLAIVPQLDRRELSALDVWREEARARDRKRRQVQALAETLVCVWPEQPGIIVDWCAGKGHLGRSLGHLLGCPVVAIEQNGALCEEGRTLASEVEVAGLYLHQDVLERERWPRMSLLQATVVALHACGDLGDAATDFAVANRAPVMAWSPCCYHRIRPVDGSVARSRVGRTHRLRLGLPELRLPTYEEVTASPTTRQRRRQKMAWLKGYDLLRRELSGEDLYVPPGPVPRIGQHTDFRAFVEHLALRNELALPSSWSADSFEERGWEQAGAARALSLVRSIFRRPLELWLVLDRALYLAEQSYLVEVGTFCGERLTRRNLLIHGVRRSKARAWGWMSGDEAE